LLFVGSEKTLKILDTSSIARPSAQVVLVLAALLTGACASVGNNPSQSQLITERLDAAAQSTGDIRHNVTDPEVARLWQETEILRRGGELENARERLQQAIEITPNDSVLWSRAAEIELDLNAFLRAENYAAKSNFLALLSAQQLRYRNWLIIQRAREGRGDLLGAREAGLEISKLTAR
jgi:outer membrane PBP1 activator LpoA protein